MNLRRTNMGIYIVPEDICLGRYVEYFGTLELPDNVRDTSFYAAFIPEGGIVINAGACIGDHTQLYSQMVGASGHVYAFEPHPRSYEALVKNMARLNNVTTFNLGLSDHDAMMELEMTPNIGASYVRHGASEWPLADVRMVTLDDQSFDLQRCDFIHLDAEGYEPTILKGAEILIERFHPTLVIEVARNWLARYACTERELLDWLKARGYEMRPLSNNVEQYDLLAIHPSKFVERVDTIEDVTHTQQASA